MFKGIWKRLEEICDEYLEEEKFEEVWFGKGEYGFGILRYKNGVVRFELYVKGKCILI